jgi:hypothetical protein
MPQEAVRQIFLELVGLSWLLLVAGIVGGSRRTSCVVISCNSLLA